MHTYGSPERALLLLDLDICETGKKIFIRICHIELGIGDSASKDFD